MSMRTREEAVAMLEKLDMTQLISMFDLLPGTLFWIKDQDCRFIHANQLFVEHSGLRCISNILGQTDYAISPPQLARQYMSDDQKVMGGEIVTNRVELNMEPSGEFSWYSTSKRPLFDSHHNIIGSYGFTHSLEQSAQTLSNVEAIKAPVEFVRKNFHQEISVTELAEISFLSVSALERRFKKYLGKTPKQFINEIRLENARRKLIETRLPILEIANQCGFAEHSYFSRQFKSMFGVLPSDLREEVTRKVSTSDLDAIEQEQHL
ncbi:MAG: AraC family transcriptional regulator [Aliiglaciecola sp.]